MPHSVHRPPRHGRVVQRQRVVRQRRRGVDRPACALQLVRGHRRLLRRGGRAHRIRPEHQHGARPALRPQLRAGRRGSVSERSIRVGIRQGHAAARNGRGRSVALQDARIPEALHGVLGRDVALHLLGQPVGIRPARLQPAAVRGGDDGRRRERRDVFVLCAQRRQHVRQRGAAKRSDPHDVESARRCGAACPPTTTPAPPAGPVGQTHTCLLPAVPQPS